MGGLVQAVLSDASRLECFFKCSSKAFFHFRGRRVFLRTLVPQILDEMVEVMKLDLQERVREPSVEHVSS